MSEKGGGLAILIVEDSEADAALVLRELRRLGRPIDFDRVDTPDAMRAALQRREWDVVISDWSMPTFSGPAALALVEELELDLPFIIVSGTIGEEHAVAAMRAGADDFVVKDKLGRLTPAIERELRDHDTRRARREAELARREAELRFQRLFDSGITGVTIGDTGGLINEANDTFLEMVGYSRDDLAAGAVNWLEMTPIEWRAESLSTKEELRTGGVVRPFEKQYVRKDGTRVPVLVSVVLLDPSRVLTIVTDLTARKLAERANVALEERLRQAQKMEAIGRLAGGVAHDFNNLLSVVLSYSSMLISDLREGDPIRGDIEQIHLAGVRAADLTRQLLMFSRQQVIEPKVIDLPALLSGMDKMLRRLVGADVELTSIFDESTGHVRADPGSIEQVVMNLVINARDAMPVGGTLTVETTNVVLDAPCASAHVGAKAGRYVVLSITDTGTGMDSATIARVFEPFFTTKEQGKGTGLGLSTVFGIVQQSAGHISVDSELGVGTTFKVYLPRVDAITDAPRSPGPTALRGSETILLVEDEDPVRGVARDILRRHGYTVLDARNAGEALLICERHVGPVDLLLSDVVMPQMSGPELAKRLVQARPSMSVLFMSGYTDDAAVRHGVSEGGFSYLQKPITVEALTRRVRDVLDTNRRAP
jgi:two-component system, cell cycle sensor histidine kinase and response regulator CckA